MQLSAIDANLLVALHALLEEQSVMRASRKLALSPSATSHALARCRELLSDPLLVRAGRKLSRTPRGEALREPLRQLVANIESVLQVGPAFQPRTLRRVFRIATTDHVQFVLLRALDALLSREAPLVDLHLVPLPPSSVSTLRDGALDFAIGVFDTLPNDLRRKSLFEDRLVPVARKGHPALRGRMTAARFAQLDHVLVAPLGSPTGLVDQQLAALGLSRRIARTVPTFLDAPFLVASSNQVVTLPEGLVRPLLSLLGLRRLRAPLPMPTFTIAAIWHRRAEADPAHAWFRDALERAV